MAICTAILSGGLAAIATLARTPGGAAAFCLLALPAAVLNTIGCLIGAYAMASGPSVDGLLFCLAFGALYGVLVGGPCGVVLGLAYVWPILSFVRARRDGSLDAFDRVLSWTGGWALLMGAGALGLGLRRPFLDEATLADAALSGLGALAFGIGVARRTLRGRWLRAVRRGRVEGFAVVPCDDVRWDTDGVPPFVGDHREMFDALVVYSPRDGGGSGGAYRDAKSRVVCARVRAT